MVSTWPCGPIGASILACWATLGAVKLWNCSLRPTHRKHYGLIFMVLSKKHLVYFALQIGSRSTGRAARQPFGGVGRGRGRGVVLGGPCSGGRVRRWWPVSYPMRASKHYELCCSQHYENYRYIDKLFHNVEGRPRVQIFIMLCTTSRPGQSTRPVGPAGRPPVRSVGPAG